MWSRAGLRATGGKFFVCAGALFVCWALAASILAIGPGVAETLLGMHQRGVFGYAIAVYLLIAGISQILSRRVNARHSLLFGCLAQVLAAVVFAVAIQCHSVGLAAVGLVVAGYAYGAIFVGSATLVNLISPPTSHARLLSLFYVIAYIANWVPILLGVVVDRVNDDIDVLRQPSAVIIDGKVNDYSVVAALAQLAVDEVPVPSTVAGSVNQYKGARSHWQLLPSKRDRLSGQLL